MRQPEAHRLALVTSGAAAAAVCHRAAPQTAVPGVLQMREELSPNPGPVKMTVPEKWAADQRAKLLRGAAADRTTANYPMAAEGRREIVNQRRVEAQTVNSARARLRKESEAEAGHQTVTVVMAAEAEETATASRGSAARQKWVPRRRSVLRQPRAAARTERAESRG